MLAAFLPRVGNTETYNILRTNCEKLALQNGVILTLEKVKTRGCGADERRIRNDSFSRVGLLPHVVCLFMLLRLCAQSLLSFLEEPLDNKSISLSLRLR